MPTPSRKYWCALDGLDLAAAAMERVRRYYTQLATTVMWRRWVRSYKAVYGLAGMDDPFDISRAMATGEEGELVSIKVNHTGSLLRRAVALVSQTVPEFEPIPANTDFKSLAQVDFAKNLLNYCMDTKGVGSGLYDTAFAAGIFGIAWFNPEWDPHAGQPLKVVDPELPQKKKTGDLTFRVVDPLDCVVNRFRYDQDHDWQIVRRWVNRYDLAARYPALEEQILGFQPERFGQTTGATNSIETERAQGAADDVDELVPLWTLYHRKSDALPEGRYAQFLSSDILLYAGNLPFREVPLIPISPGKFLRTPNGDSPVHHILGLQDVVDNLMSAVASNNVAFATQLVLIPEEADYSVTELAKGLTAIRYNAGPEGRFKPEGLNLTAPNEQALKLVDVLREAMETLAGISATLRGNPQANIQSGAFAALVAQQALEYAGAYQYSFQQAVRRTGNLIIQLLKSYASAPLVAEIAGKSKAYEIREFTSADLSEIDRVIVRSGNPAARTAQFAIATADSLLAKGQVDAKEYLSLVRTGHLEQVMDVKEAEELNIRRENELIGQGKTPPVVATDDHREHILRHAAQIGDPGVREDSKAVGAGLGHIQAHIDALSTTNPALLTLLGQTPLPPPGAPPAPMGSQPAPDAPPGPQGDQGGPDPVPPAPPHQGAELPDQPGMPINPTTGQTWSPQDGSIQQ